MGRRIFQAEYSIIPTVVESALSLGADEVVVRLSNKSWEKFSLIYDVEVSGNAIPDGDRGLRVSTNREEGAVTKTVQWE